MSVTQTIRDEHLKQLEAGAKAYSYETKAMATELLAWRASRFIGESLVFNGYEFEMRVTLTGKRCIQVTKPNGESFIIPA